MSGWEEIAIAYIDFIVVLKFHEFLIAKRCTRSVKNKNNIHSRIYLTSIEITGELQMNLFISYNIQQ